MASLFPGHRDAAATGVMTVAVTDSPKPPPQRVSLTFDAIQAAHAVLVIVGGENKADAVGRGLGDPDPVTTPGSCARGQGSTTWYLDEVAAAGYLRVRNGPCGGGEFSPPQHRPEAAQVSVAPDRGEAIKASTERPRRPGSTALGEVI